MTRPESILFVFNPKASRATDIRLEQEICARLADHSAPPRCEFLDLEPDAFLEKTLEKKLRTSAYDTVVAVGGDGTVRHVATALAAFPGTRLGIIPLGTGNVLAKSLGIPLDFRKALGVVFSGQEEKIQVAMINGREIFTLAAGVGLDAEIMKTTAAASKKIFGQLAYLFHGIVSIFRSRKAIVRVRIDDRRVITSAVGIFILNRQDFFESMLPVNPIPETEKDLLNVFIFNARTNFDYLTGLVQVFTQDYGRRKKPIRHYKGRRVEIHAWPRMWTQVDGDVYGRTPVVIEVSPCDLTVLIPDERQSAVREDELSRLLNVFNGVPDDENQQAG